MKKAFPIILISILIIASIIWLIRPMPLAGHSIADIKARGYLSIHAIRESGINGLPRKLSANQREIAAVSAFAESLGVKANVTYHDDYTEMLRKVALHEGDVAVANIVKTPERARQLSFSEPFLITPMVLITNTSNPANSLSEIQDGTITVQFGTAYEKFGLKLQENNANIKVLSNSDWVENIIAGVENGEYMYTIAERNIFDIQASYSHNLKIIHTFEENPCEICWVFPYGTSELRVSANEFIEKNKSLFQYNISTADWDVISERNILRVLTRDNPSNYFCFNEELKGFEYEMSRTFATENDCTLAMVVPFRGSELLPALKEGIGDVVAASFSRADSYLDDPDFAYSIPYAVVQECVIGQKGKTPHTLDALKGRTFHVRKSSSYNRTLEELASTIGFQVKHVPESFETYEIMNRLETGEYDLSLIDDRIYYSTNDVEHDLEKGVILGVDKYYVWVVRKSNPQLLQKIDSFLTEILPTPEHHEICARYFTKNIIPDTTYVATDSQFISPYDNLFKKYGQNLGLEWFLIAAQAFIESRFNSNAHAKDGGKGLLQLMPQTIKEMQCKDPWDPDENVRAGTGYLIKLMDRLPPEISSTNRLAFGLAAYNGGYGHLMDARVLARRLNLDQNVWKNNVEVAYRKLREAQYASRSRYGFCRSEIIINYVNSITSQRNSFRRIYYDSTSKTDSASKTDSTLSFEKPLKK